MITSQSLKQNGFQRTDGQYFPGNIALHTKRAKNDVGATLYFIQVYESVEGNFSVECRLYKNDGNYSFNVNFIVDDTLTVEDLVQRYAFIYHSLGCIPDVHNND